MVPNLSLSFGILIAHFIPGASLVLLLLFRYNNKVSEVAKIVDLAGQNTTLGIIIGIIASLAAGLILDAARYSIINSIKYFSKRFREWDKYNMPDMNKDDIACHEWIIENRYRFHQLYGNFSLIFVIGIFTCLPTFLMIANFVLLLICFLASFFSYRTTVNQLRERFPKT